MSQDVANTATWREQWEKSNECVAWLQAENKRLRDALGEIVKFGHVYPCEDDENCEPCMASRIASRALAEQAVTRKK